MRRTILAILLLIVLLTLTACGEKTFTVGDSAEVTIVKAYCAKNLISNHTSYYARSGKTHVVVEVDFKNISGRLDAPRDLLDARLMIPDSTYGAVGTIAILTDSEDLNPNLMIPDGETCRVYIMFQVDESKAQGTHEMTLSAGGGTVKVKVKAK